MMVICSAPDRLVDELAWKDDLDFATHSWIQNRTVHEVYAAHRPGD